MIVIALWLSTIARMDRLIVLEKGSVAESGTHHELLKRNCLHAGFWNRQAGGFIDIEADA